MSEHERPAAVTDDEQPAAPTPATSADAPVTGPTDGAGQTRAQVARPVDDAGPAEPQPTRPVETDAQTDGAGPAPEATDSLDSPGAVATDGRSALLRPRNLAVVGIAVSALVVAAVVGTLEWDASHRDDGQIATPQRVAGLVLDDSQGAHDTIDYLRTAVQTGVSLQKSTGAVYADEAGESRSVLFIGGTGSVGSPEDALTKTFRLISDDTGGVDGVQSVSPGPLGGVMRCGSTKTDGGSMAVCGWADRRSLGVAMFPNRPVDQSADLLRAMRQVMQKER